MIHPAVHVHEFHAGHSSNSSCSHSCCHSSNHRDGDPFEDSTETGHQCELCAASCEREPLEFGNRLVAAIENDPPLFYRVDTSQKKIVQVILTGSLSQRGPPSAS
jgi:NAD-dependent dihydropyrimidine dehydrogenase PreA subunit